MKGKLGVALCLLVLKNLDFLTSGSMQNLSIDRLREMENGAGGTQTNPDCQLAGVVPRWAVNLPWSCHISHNKEQFVWKKKKNK